MNVQNIINIIKYNPITTLSCTSLIFINLDKAEKIAQIVMCIATIFAGFYAYKAFEKQSEELRITQKEVNASMELREFEAVREFVKGMQENVVIKHNSELLTKRINAILIKDKDDEHYLGLIEKLYIDLGALSQTSSPAIEYYYNISKNGLYREIIMNEISKIFDYQTRQDIHILFYETPEHLENFKTKLDGIKEKYWKFIDIIRVYGVKTKEDIDKFKK